MSKVSVANYNGGEDEILVFYPESLILEHEHASLSNSFALRFCGDKVGGTYIEIGSSHYKDRNNTYFLEQEFNWTGVSLEIQEHYVNEHNLNRKNPCIQADAMSFNWDEYLEFNNFPKQIDYLVIDTDQCNLRSLMNLPLSRYRFNTIVIEHRIPRRDPLEPGEIDVQSTQHSILKNYGYTLVGSGYTDDYWIDNRSLRLMGNQWDAISFAFYNNIFT